MGLPSPIDIIGLLCGGGRGRHLARNIITFFCSLSLLLHFPFSRESRGGSDVSGRGLFFFFSSRLASVAPRWSEMAEEGGEMDSFMRGGGRLSLQASTYYYFPESHMRVFARRSEERGRQSVNASDVLF